MVPAKVPSGTIFISTSSVFCLSDSSFFGFEAFLDGLGAQRIPDPTTSGDFTRRFEEHDILDLMEITNTVRERVWRYQPRGFLTEALIDTDGTIAPTFGECKGGMALSYKGIWGYAPLVVSLANTNEVLYLGSFDESQIVPAC